MAGPTHDVAVRGAVEGVGGVSEALDHHRLAQPTVELAHDAAPGEREAADEPTATFGVQRSQQVSEVQHRGEARVGVPR